MEESVSRSVALTFIPVQGAARMVRNRQALPACDLYRGPACPVNHRGGSACSLQSRGGLHALSEVNTEGSNLLTVTGE